MVEATINNGLKEVLVVKSNKLIILSMILIMAYFISQIQSIKGTENITINSGVGSDVATNHSGIDQITILSTYVFGEENKVTHKTYFSTSVGPAKSRESRQQKNDKVVSLGFEKVYIISEEVARLGINKQIDVLLKNPLVNDKGYMVICKGKAYDMMDLNIKGYPSSADFIQGLVASCKDNNFYSDKYSFLNVFTTVDAEGKILVLPYIEIKEKQPVIAGLAVFKKDKLAEVLSIPDARMLNLLREKQGRGVFDIINGPYKSISYETTSMRKVKCNKKNGKYKFTIDLSFNGEISGNMLYKDITQSTRTQKGIRNSYDSENKKRLQGFY